ncbi:MAG: low specificity L-threonine aldolase [Hyphomicrobiales bacterium]|nr:low specificity L-threonine aldolase [Hyphomicrobiales bacterium]
MRRAMADAEVGDDSYRDDPTVARLEALAAEVMGKEAALLVLSGTMGNLVAMLSQVRNGGAVLVDEHAHIFRLESGNLAGVCGITARPFRAGARAAEDVFHEESVFANSRMHRPADMLCLENTHNFAGGRCLPVEVTATLADAARARGMHVHIDGARIFNAAVALGTTAAELVAPADTITFCLSKGLGAPVGSLLCGPVSVIEEARRWRQMVGGGMRQAGVFAAAGLVALQGGWDQLTEDHANAKTLAVALNGTGLDIDPAAVETNIVYVRIPFERIEAGALVSRLIAAGVIVNPPKGDRLRFVLHRDVSRSDMDEAIRRIRGVLD